MQHLAKYFLISNAFHYLPCRSTVLGHNLNVANILLQLDEEDIDVIQSELTDTEIDQLNPALQVKFEGLGTM